jgi:hypothetical protein
MLAIWNEFARFVSDAFAVGLILSAGVQWLVLRSHWAARALSWVAQSVGQDAYRSRPAAELQKGKGGWVQFGILSSRYSRTQQA